MKIRSIKLPLLSLLAMCAGALAAGQPELKPFPAAKEGMDRFVIVLPHKERGEEDAFRVEIITGREMLTDGVNVMHLGYNIEARNLEGWGYTYYEVTGSGEAMSTLMEPPPGAPKVKKFVTGQSLQILYNSRVPIVVYAPKGVEVRYRVWKAADTFDKAEKQ